jgi:transposase
MARKPYPSDVTDEEWDFIAPYLTLMKEDAPQREHVPREVFNGLRWIVRTGSQWGYIPHDLPPWQAVFLVRWLLLRSLVCLAAIGLWGQRDIGGCSPV